MDYKYDVFISYSRKNTPEADRLCRVLDKVGISYFIDRQSISGGMEFPVAIAESILRSRLFLLLASENAYRSKFTTNELTYAYSKKAADEIVVCQLDDAPMPPGFEIATGGALKYDSESGLESDLAIGIYTRLNNGDMPDDDTSFDIAMMMRGDDKFTDYVNWILTPAHNGHAKACFYLGSDFITSESENNAMAALRFLNTASDKGIVEASLVLGGVYEVGSGHIPASAEKALGYYRTAALSDTLGEGQYEYGRCLLEGIGTVPDVAEAEKWLRKAVENGNENASKLLEDPRFGNKADRQYDNYMMDFIDSLLTDVNSRRLDDTDDATEPPAQLDEAAKADALMGQGRLFDALALYLRTRQPGDEILEENHPVIRAIKLKYSDTEIAERKDLFFQEDNIPATAQLLKILAEKGDCDSAIDLGCLYLLDKGLKTDIDKAVRYLKTGAEHGDTYSLSTLASIFDGSFGNEPNRAEAFRYYAMAAEAGDTASMFGCGRYLMEGLAGVTDIDEGLRLIRRAAEANSDIAQFYMYELCTKGVIDDDADKWLALAAENGNHTAQVIRNI